MAAHREAPRPARNLAPAASAGAHRNRGSCRDRGAIARHPDSRGCRPALGANGRARNTRSEPRARSRREATRCRAAAASEAKYHSQRSAFATASTTRSTSWPVVFQLTTLTRIARSPPPRRAAEERFAGRVDRRDDGVGAIAESKQALIDDRNREHFGTGQLADARDDFIRVTAAALHEIGQPAASKEPQRSVSREGAG